MLLSKHPNLKKTNGPLASYLHITAQSLENPVYASSKAPLCFELSSTLVKNAPMLCN